MRADDLFQQHAPELSGFFHRRLGSPDQAADLCQEGYLRLRRLEKGAARKPMQLPADITLPPSSSALTPRAPMDAKRMSVVYQQRYLTPLSPGRREAEVAILCLEGVFGEITEVILFI